MAKLIKHAEVLGKLHELLQKEADAQSNIKGTPAAEPKKESVSDKTETVAKNEVKPEQLNKSQGPEQKPAAKTAELGKDILSMVSQKTAEEAAGGEKKTEVQESIKGTPAADPKKESVSDKTENVDKNAVKPENNKPQGPDQEKGKEDAKVASDEEVKKASYELGQKLAELLVKEAQENNEVELMKEAGRRDFDLLVAQAAETLQKEEQEKQAAAAGAAYCDEMMKTAALEVLANENAELKKQAEDLKTEIAAHKAHEAKESPAMKKKEEKAEKAVDAQEPKVAAVDYEKIASMIVEGIKSELSKQPAPAAK